MDTEFIKNGYRIHKKLIQNGCRMDTKMDTEWYRIDTEIHKVQNGLQIDTEGT